jgi:two-component system, cell cycle sensor histidine kinase and response regulator CckA
MNRLMTIIGDLTQWFRFHRVTNGSPRRILIVDDEEPMRLFLHTVLATAGYDSVVAADGPDALATLEREGPFDVIVTDVMMPQMRGYELAQRARQVESAIKILYVTGYSEALFRERPTLWENEAFLEKPCTPDSLLQALSRLVYGGLQHKIVWG